MDQINASNTHFFMQMLRYLSSAMANRWKVEMVHNMHRIR